MERIKEYVEYKPLCKTTYNEKTDNYEDIYYETSFYCLENKIIHPNLKSALKCNDCFSELERIEYEAVKRLEWFTENYVKLNLDGNFSKMSTEDICKKYKLNIRNFKPWW
jgi:hypothetical protein